MSRHRIHVCRFDQDCMEVLVEFDEDDGSCTVVSPEVLPADVAARMAGLIEETRRTMLAERRAEALLRRLLTPDQRVEYDRDHRITVTGSDGGRYEIDCRGSYSGNVRSGRWSYCAYPDYQRPRWEDPRMPRHDAYLGQLLLLQTDEPRFLDVAVPFRRD